MTKSKRWPNNAEAARVESIAHARRIRAAQSDISKELRPILGGRMDANEVMQRVSKALMYASDAAASANEIERQLNTAKDCYDE